MSIVSAPLVQSGHQDRAAMGFRRRYAGQSVVARPRRFLGVGLGVPRWMMVMPERQRTPQHQNTCMPREKRLPSISGRKGNRSVEPRSAALEFLLRCLVLRRPRCLRVAPHIKQEVPDGIFRRGVVVGVQSGERSRALTSLPSRSKRGVEKVPPQN